MEQSERERRCSKRPASARFDVRRRFDAVLPADCGGSWSSRRLLARLPGVARMYPDAGIQSGAILLRCEGGYARDCHAIDNDRAFIAARDTNVLQTSRCWDTESVPLL